MRVAEITADPILHGGHEKFISNLIKNNPDKDVQIDVITPYQCENEDFRKTVAEKGGKVIALGLPFLRGKSRKLLYKPIYALLKSEHYDVVHIHSGSISALAYIARAAHKAGVGKIVVHSHSTAVQSLKHRLVKMVFGPQLTKYATDYLACSAEAGKDKFPASVVKNRLVIIKNGIAVEDYKRDEITRAKQRELLGIPEDAFVIGHVGRFAFEKNHAFLLELFEEYYKNAPDSMLLLVGDGELKDEIVEKIARSGLGDKIILTGNVDNIEDYYQVMDVFVLPSLYEGFPYVTLEAQAAGIPCVVSTGVTEEVMIGQGVVRVDLKDKELWLEEIEKARSAGITDNANAITAAGYDIRDTVETVLELYKKG